MQVTRTTVAIGLGLLLAANGLFMLADPVQWYAMVPGVPETGPFNPHFVRDIGAIYWSPGARSPGSRWTSGPFRQPLQAHCSWLCTRLFTSPTRSPGGSTRNTS